MTVDSLRYGPESPKSFGMGAVFANGTETFPDNSTQPVVRQIGLLRQWSDSLMFIVVTGGTTPGMLPDTPGGNTMILQQRYTVKRVLGAPRLQFAGGTWCADLPAVSTIGAGQLVLTAP